MAPVSIKWNEEEVAMLSAEGNIRKEDILELMKQMTSGELAQNKKIYIDLSKVSFFSPFAASLLFGNYRKINESGKKLMFINPNEVSEFLIKLFGADYIFPIVDGC